MKVTGKNRWDYFRPSAPTNLNGTAGNSQVTLTWTAASSISQIPVTHYIVQYSSNDGQSWTTFNNSILSSTVATVTGLTNGTSYKFRVAAINGVGQGGWSTITNTITAGVPYLAGLVDGTIHGLYSVRLARSSYSGSILKIRRSNDGEQLDIFPGYNGVSAWLGANSATVVRWYDQSGNGAHLDYYGSEPIFTLTGEAGSNFNPFITVSSSSKLMGAIADLDGNTSALISAIMAPIGSQSAGPNGVDRAIAFIGENSGWGTISMSVLASTLAWRFGTGSSGNTPSRSRVSSSNSWCVATISKYGTTEKAYINAQQLGETYTASGSSLTNNSTTLEVGGGDTLGGPDAKICELIICVNPGTGKDVVVASNQTSFIGL